ncbi:MAG TPA: hypothetical protein DEA62_02480 [Coxiellaceae bacterium]|nr:hypothetical protein [Coxiellaceae bacterium]HBS51840.1 hypothetical protein [Coxiellaceae bacterium]
MQNESFHKYTYVHCDKMTDKEEREITRMAMSCFKVNEDPGQMQMNQSRYIWIKEKMPECFTVIKYCDKVIGGVFILPCTIEIMNEFIDNKITEEQLADRVYKEGIDQEKMETIYMCAAIVDHAHRRKGLATSALLKSAEVLTQNKIPSAIFYWPFFNCDINTKPENVTIPHSIARRIANTLGVDLFIRKY